MGFTQARAPTEKLPKVAHRRKEEQGGEELEPCPLSSWGLDMFLSTAGKCFILVQIQVSLSQSATNVRKLKGPVVTCSRGALCREVSMRQATQQPPHSRAVRVLNCSSTEPQHEGSEAPSFKRHHLHSTTGQNGGTGSSSCRQQLAEAAGPAGSADNAQQMRPRRAI